ncbi:molecular chaperone (plasmid) [Enterobacter asburiae]|uniref:fimbrial biogenesis chaperone n=1 Tax=Enterobacter asburiae TaxID=61645 RepID=UPI0032AFBEAF
MNHNIKIQCRSILSVFFIIIAISFFVSEKTYAGVVLGNTRLIFPADSKDVTLSLKNTEKSQTFLVQSSIENSQSEKQQSFAVTPPLFVLKPGGENKIRIFMKNTIPISANKETLFWLSVKAIPSSERQEEGNFLQFSVTNKIKLLYRPNGLASPDESVWGKITFTHRGGVLVMHNPTPYYMNIASLKIGTVILENMTLSPNESQVVSHNTTNSDLAEVVFINDFGGESNKIKVPVT